MGYVLKVIGFAHLQILIQDFVVYKAHGPTEAPIPVK